MAGATRNEMSVLSVDELVNDEHAEPRYEGREVELFGLEIERNATRRVEYTRRKMAHMKLNREKKT